MLSTATGSFNLNFEEDFGNNYFSCTLKINNIVITPPKPISITDTLFKDILCFGDKPHLDAMNQMQELAKTPDAMKEWFDNKRKEFNAM